MHNNRLQSDFGKLRLPQPLMRATWTPPPVKRSRFLTRDIRLQLYIRSTSGRLVARTKMSIRWKRPHSLDDLFDLPHQQASISSV